MTSLFVMDPSQNVRRFTWYYALSGLTFTLPIWVAFYLRIVTIEQLALINATAGVITVALEIPTGALADLLGRKFMSTVGQVLRAGMFFMIPFADNFTSLMIINIIMAVGESMGSGADTALFYDTLKSEGREEEFGTIYAKILTYYRICLIVGSLVGGLSYMYWFGTPYWLRGAAYILSALSIFLMFEPKRQAVKFSISSYLETTRLGLQELRKSTFVKKLALYYVAVGGITWSCLTYFNQPFAYDFGWSTTQMSYITAAAYLISSLVVLFLTSHKTLLNRQRVYLGFPLFMVIALLPGIFVNKWIALILMTLIQVAGSARFSILDRYANMEFDSRHRATALSALNMLVSLVVSGLIFFGGKIEGIADTRTVFTLLGILSLVFVAPLALMLVSDHRRHKK